MTTAFDFADIAGMYWTHIDVEITVFTRVNTPLHDEAMHLLLLVVFR